MSLKNSKLPQQANLSYQAPTAPPTAPPSILEESLRVPAPGAATDYTGILRQHGAGRALRPETDAIAILVFHGMGEQVRYETLGGLAKSLLSSATSTKVSTSVQMARPVDSFIAHAEIQWDDDGTHREVHLYEAYWAPLTEGKITYLETLSFLVSAARKGIKSSRFGRVGYFERYMFNKVVDLPIAAGTKIALLGVLGLLLLMAGAIFAAALLYANVIKGIGFTKSQVIATILPTLHFFSSVADRLHAHIWAIVTSLLFWALVAGLLVLRTKIMQYVGDVAAYISPFKASKFQSLRNDIQKVGFDAASYVYGFTSAEVPRYRKVLFVGHSLGSVIAYDTLNAIINLDQTTPTARTQNVLGRTHALITFGSPLDKTAFLFRNQANTLDDPLREQMAAASQPLIADYANRKPGFHWTNIWSPMDIISGALDYYDDPAATTNRVENLRDPQASKPILAHVQYWNNDMLTKTLLEQIRRP